MGKRLIWRATMLDDANNSMLPESMSFNQFIIILGERKPRKAEAHKSRNDDKYSCPWEASNETGE